MNPFVALICWRLDCPYSLESRLIYSWSKCYHNLGKDRLVEKIVLLNTREA